ncbi:MAG: hypothetical protein QGI60_03305 [archaeon]|nr:hypothetical protein [archaeon]
MVSGAIAEKIEVKEIASQLSERKSEVNFILNTMSIPEPVKQLFGNETINVFIAMGDGSNETVGIKTKDTKVQAIKYNGFENETLHVFVSEETIRDILANDDPLDAAITALINGKITYRGVGFASAAKFGILGFLQSIFAFFAGLIGI